MAPKPARTQRGFTVMETIMAFSILTLALSGFSGMMVSSLKSFRLSQEKYVAAKIAQEGIELAVNKKDNHVQCVKADPSCPLSDWQENLLGSFEVESGRSTELRPQSSFQSYDSNHVICVKRNPPKDFGKFGYCSAEPQYNLSANYNREVIITRLNANSVQVRSVVRWKNNKSLTLESLLFSR